MEISGKIIKETIEAKHWREKAEQQFEPNRIEPLAEIQQKVLEIIKPVEEETFDPDSIKGLCGTIHTLTDEALKDDEQRIVSDIGFFIEALMKCENEWQEKVLRSFLEAGLIKEQKDEDRKKKIVLRPRKVNGWLRFDQGTLINKRWESFFYNLYLGNKDLFQDEIIQINKKSIYNKESVITLLAKLFEDRDDVEVENTRQYYQNQILDGFSEAGLAEEKEDEEGKKKIVLRPRKVNSWTRFDQGAIIDKKWESFFYSLYQDNKDLFQDEIIQISSMQVMRHKESVIILLNKIFEDRDDVEVENTRQYYQNQILDGFREAGLAEEKEDEEGKKKIVLRLGRVNGWLRFDQGTIINKRWESFFYNLYLGNKDLFQDKKINIKHQYTIYNKEYVITLLTKLFEDRDDVEVEVKQSSEPNENQTVNIKHHRYTQEEEDLIFNKIVEVEIARILGENIERLVDKSIEELSKQITGVNMLSIKNKWNAMSEILGALSYNEEIENDLLDLMAQIDEGSIFEENDINNILNEISENHNIDIRVIKVMFRRIQRIMNDENGNKEKEMRNLRVFPNGIGDKSTLNIMAKLLDLDIKSPVIAGCAWESVNGFKNIILPLPFKESLNEYSEEEMRIIRSAQAYLLNGLAITKQEIHGFADTKSAIHRVLCDIQDINEIKRQEVELCPGKTCLEIYVKADVVSERENDKTAMGDVYVNTGNEGQVLNIVTWDKKLTYEEGDRLAS